MMLKQYPVWLGLAVFVAVHFVVGGGWWLDSGRGVLTMLTAVAAGAFVVGITSPKNTWLPALHFWIGVMAGMAVILFSMGPGSIWPIVLVIGGGMAGMAIVVGFVSGVLLRAGVQVLRKATQ